MHYSSQQLLSKKKAEWWRWKLSSGLYFPSHHICLFTVLFIGYQFCCLQQHKQFSLSVSALQMILFSACCICGLIGGILNFQFVRALNKRPDSMHSIHLAAMTLACLGKQKFTGHNKSWSKATQHNITKCVFISLFLWLWQLSKHINASGICLC